MNWFDLLVIAILVVSIFIAYKSGFVRTVCDFCSTIVSLVLTYKLYPITASIFKNLKWFEKIQTALEENLKLSQNAEKLSENMQNSIINDLELPQFLKNILIENNTMQTELINTSQLEEYISSYVANICLNAAAVLVTFIILVIAIKVAINLLDLVAKLPILNFLNKTAGIAIGFLRGAIIIWIICFAIMIFYSNPNFQNIVYTVENSVIGKLFYDNNLLVFMITKVTI